MTTGQSNVVNITPYRSYLVRFWQSNEQGIWRASAQSVQSGNTILFGDIDHLLAFLQTEIQDNPRGYTIIARQPQVHSAKS